MGVGPEVVGWVGVAEKQLRVTEGRLGAGGAGNLAVVAWGQAVEVWEVRF